MLMRQWKRQIPEINSEWVFRSYSSIYGIGKTGRTVSHLYAGSKINRGFSARMIKKPAFFAREWHAGKAGFLCLPQAAQPMPDNPLRGL